MQPQQVQVTPPGDLEALLLTWPPQHNLVCGQGVITADPIVAGVPLD